MDKKLKNKIKRIINNGLVDCYIRYNQAGNYKDYQFYGNRSKAIKEATRWIWLDYEHDMQMDLQGARDDRKHNLESLKRNGIFDKNGMDAFLLYRLDKDNLISLGYSKNVVELAEELKEELVILPNESFSEIVVNAMQIVDNRISEVTDEEERQELVDNKEAVALALVLLCSYFDYSDLKIKKKVNR